MPLPDPLGELNAKINSVIARLEQDGISDAERKALEGALDHYIDGREELLIGELDKAIAQVAAGDSELAKASEPSAGVGQTVGTGTGTGVAPGVSSPGGGGGTPTSRDQLSATEGTADAATRPLSQAGLLAACHQLGVGAAEVWAVVFTECDPPYSGYFRDGRPQILFERHIFHRLTGGRFDNVDPDVSNARAGGYGAGGSHQYDRLKRAMALDESAAIQSASWGMGQTLGSNFKTLGYSSPQDLMSHMFASEDQQLDGMVREIRATKIAGALAAHDWKTFASVYNGPNYAVNNYDGHLQSWFAKFASGALPDLRIRAAQMYLMFLGLQPSDIDGMWGKRSRAAMNQFQAMKGLPRTDTLDDPTFAALVAAGEAVKPAP
jgi:hypothetical protein